MPPSDHTTKEFKELYALVKPFCDDDGYYFTFEDNKKDLMQFIADNFTLNTEVTALEVDKNNFVHVFHQWLKEVKDSINYDWSKAREFNVIESDFFLADLFSEDNIDIRGGYVTLDRNKYVIHEGVDDLGGEKEISVKFKDHQEAHKRFWKRYKRPPKKDFWDYILERRDLLVPQDVRERKGSFFTPQQWVQLSQHYIADVLGEDWQDEYYVWDCAAGTGNLLFGLTNKRNLFASTLDKADVAIMKESAHNGALSLFEGNIFQFDFLNDNLNDDKVPKALKDILNDPEKRKNLVIYINPPYAEATNRHTIKGNKKHKANTSNDTYISKSYKNKMGKSSKELFAQFLIRIQHEIKAGVIAQFSTLKTVQSINFKKFRQQWTYKAVSAFLAPANSFDNVKGKFPIGFFIWKKGEPNWLNFDLQADIYNRNGGGIGTHLIRCYDGKRNIREWRNQYLDKQSEIIGYLRNRGLDVQQNNLFTILSEPNENDIKNNMTLKLTVCNLLPFSVYHAVRRTVSAGHH